MARSRSPVGKSLTFQAVLSDGGWNGSRAWGLGLGFSPAEARADAIRRAKADPDCDGLDVARLRCDVYVARSWEKVVCRTVETNEVPTSPKRLKPLPRGFRRGHDDSVACRHRDLSCCAACAALHVELVDVAGVHFWVPTESERAELRRAISAVDSGSTS